MNSEQQTVYNTVGAGRRGVATQVLGGYKRTEVGVIPSEWQVARIGDLFESTAGGDFDPTRSSGVQSDRHPYPIYANGLSQEGLYGFCNYAENRPGSITVTARGTLGKAFCRDTPFAAIGRLLVLVPKVRMDARFFSDYINHGVHFAVESTGVPQLTAPQVARYLLPVPSEPEQRAIAEALSDVDELLGSLEKLIAKKRAIKQAAMQQLLTGKTRLPGFSGAWTKTTLGELCSTYSGGTPSTSKTEFYGGHIPWITSSDLNTRRIKEVSGRITQEGFDSSASRMASRGDIVLALYGATAGVVAVAEIDAAINQAVLAIIPNNCDSEYLFQYLESRKDQIVQTYAQGGQPNLSGVIIRSLLVLVPPFHEQTAIAAVLSDMDAEIAALERRRDKTSAIKQGMMQQLLTGRVRLVKSK